MNSNLFIIAKSGWHYIAYTLAAFIVFELLDLEFLALLSLIAMLFSLFLFRNPEREAVLLENDMIFSPVDGIVTSIEELNDPSYAYKIEICSSCFNVAVLRAPMTSEVVAVKIVRGSRVGIKSKLFSLLNEYAEIVFQDKNENSIKVVHRLKQGFAPISLDIIKQQKLLQGGRYGLAQNGITTLYFQKNFTTKLQVGQEVLAAVTSLGEIN